MREEDLLSTKPVISGELSGVYTVIGSVSVPKEIDVEKYTGVYEVEPSAHEEQVLETKNKFLNENVVVLKVPYFVTSNTSGNTVYIASEVE